MKRKTAKRVLFIALSLVVIWPIFAWAAARSLIVQSEVSHADAIVVLAGSATYLERTHHAARLFRAGRAPRVVLTNDHVLSGWSEAQQRNQFFSERAVDELKRAGVPADKIEIVPGAVLNTFDEASHVRDFANECGWRSVLAVTSAYQSRRVGWTIGRVFNGTGVTAGVDPAPPGEQSPPAATWWLHRFGWQLVPVEYAKIIYYHVKY